MPYEKYLENDTISVESKAPFARMDFSAKMITQIELARAIEILICPAQKACTATYHRRGSK
jgi:hypothetical protein